MLLRTRPALVQMEDRLTPCFTLPMLTAGHADIGLAYEDGEWSVHVHDEDNDVEYHSDEVLLFVGPQAKTTQTANPAFSFLGAGVGKNIWILPQSPNPNLLYLGVAAEEIDPELFTSDITLSLINVRGAGHFSAYSLDPFGMPIIHMATSDGITTADFLTIEVGHHSHFNFAFTQPGRYEIDFEAKGMLAGGGTSSSGIVTILFQVHTQPQAPELIPVANHFGNVQWMDGTGSVVATVNLPAAFVRGSITATPDRTGDCFPDLIVGTGAGQASQVAIIDGKTGTVIQTFAPYAPSFRGGVNVASGDINGDGTADVLVAPGFGGGPHVKAYDGVSFAEIRSFLAYAKNFTGGVNIAAGDVDGDGFADIITGPGITGGPNVRVFSGKTQMMIRNFLAYAPNFTGGIDVSGGDFNGDGFADLFVGPQNFSSHARIFSGVDNSLLFNQLTNPGSSYGIRVLAADTNGDGLSELIVLNTNATNAQLVSYHFSGIAPFTPQFLIGFARPAGSPFIVTI